MRWKGDGNVRMMRGVRIREIISWRGREGFPLTESLRGETFQALYRTR